MYTRIDEINEKVLGDINRNNIDVLIRFFLDLEKNESLVKKSKKKKVYKPLYPDYYKFAFIGDTDEVKNHGGILTIVTRKMDNEIHYGYSFCSPDDVYDKNKGKGIASRRMVTNFNEHKVKPFKIKHRDIISAVIADIYSQKLYPDWAYELVKGALEANLW